VTRSPDPRSRPAHRRGSNLALALAVSALLAVTSTALAQIGHDPDRFVDAAGLTASEDDADRFEGAGVEVELELRSGVLYAVRGVAVLDAEAIETLARVIGAATGFHDEIEGPVADYLTGQVPDLSGRGEVIVGVERYRLTLDVSGDAEPYTVRYGLGLAEVDPSAFPTARHAIGPDDAGIVIREFSDFQCPFCKRFVEEVLPLLEATVLHRDDVRFEFHHFPLQSIHANAFRAAEASECVTDANRGDTGAFWAYHDGLFATLEDWSRLADPDAFFVELASEVGLSDDGVSTCLEAGTHRATVDAAYGAAIGLQLRGTPSVFVNGYLLDDFTRLESYLETIALIEAFAGPEAGSAEDESHDEPGDEADGSGEE
jgi:protein-disulfide isomerase